MLVEGVVECLQRASGGVGAVVERVVAVHQHLGLDDRHDARLLAQRRVARKRMRVRVRARSPVGSRSPMKIVARHFANRAPSS